VKGAVNKRFFSFSYTVQESAQKDAEKLDKICGKYEMN
jgi:hypothetical protein